MTEIKIIFHGDDAEIAKVAFNDSLSEQDLLYRFKKYCEQETDVIIKHI